MAAALALAVYAPLLAAAAVIVWRRPVLALYAFAVGLALHNLAMVLLYGAGVRGSALTAIAAWKEILLVVALAAAVLPPLRERRLPFRPGAVDVLALAFALVVVVYALVPQDVLDGDAGVGGIAQAARYALTPVAAYMLGRSLTLGRAQLARLALTIAATAGFVAAFGLIEVYAVSLDWWRGSGAPGWFRDQLDLQYRGLSGLPENFVYNPGGERPLRRLVSTFLSPLATAYLLVVGALLVFAWRSGPRAVRVVAVLIFAGLLFTHTRAALLALAIGLVGLAALARRWSPVLAAAAVLALGAGFLAVYDDVAPRASFTPAELEYQRSHARQAGDVEHGPLSPGEPSAASHWRNLRDGFETVARHPQGYGLGNAGTPARRFHERLRAGESTYTEMGVETGVLGLLLLVAWSLALLVELVRRREVDVAAGLAAALVAALALAVQTDVLAVPWLTYCLWSLAGAVVMPVAWPARAAALARPDTVEA